jgi:hypothetical protein
MFDGWRRVHSWERKGFYKRGDWVVKQGAFANWALLKGFWDCRD